MWLTGLLEKSSHSPQPQACNQKDTQLKIEGESGHFNLLLDLDRTKGINALENVKHIIFYFFNLRVWFNKLTHQWHIYKTSILLRNFVRHKL